MFDADGRLDEAYSSLDGVIWNLDARYLYYLHGPLARVELGENQVQGLDYAYTLQGWLKSLNPYKTHCHSFMLGLLRNVQPLP